MITIDAEALEAEGDAQDAPADNFAGVTAGT
jgi:hypothetical protein